MALKIDTISITLMNKGAHSNYMETVLEYLDKYEPVKAKAQTEYSNLSAALETENQYFNVPKKSENTAEIVESDRLRDAHLMGYENALDYAISSLTDATKLQYAKRLKQHLKEANIDKRAQRDKQTGRMTNFIEDLETKYATEVAALELEVYVAGMKAANEAVKAHSEDRAEEYSTRVKGALKKARAETDDAYRALVEKIHALIVIEGDTDYQDFVKLLNTEIDRYKREVLNQPSKDKDEDKEEDDRPVTGDEETPGEGSEEKPDDQPTVDAGEDDGEEDLPQVQ